MAASPGSSSPEALLPPPTPPSPPSPLPPPSPLVPSSLLCSPGSPVLPGSGSRSWSSTESGSQHQRKRRKINNKYQLLTPLSPFCNSFSADSPVRQACFNDSRTFSQDSSSNSCLAGESCSETDYSSGSDAGDADMPIVEEEAVRLIEVIRACIEGGLSSRSIQKVLKARSLQCKCSYEAIENLAKRQARVQKDQHRMCPDGHMVIVKNSEEELGSCRVQNCTKTPTTSDNFWHLSLIGQLQALAGQSESYTQLAEGQQQATTSLQDANPSVYSDHSEYCGWAADR